ncbi:hypothetical protein BJY00DRAFT_312041 [Aspergillus carlsbadensis]|nr:hypothetical protein BJY00DRAFT_312041 [Aspergillus carlsbadensis]
MGLADLRNFMPVRHGTRRSCTARPTGSQNRLGDSRTSIIDLPLELLEVIARDLPLPALKNLRLTCGYLYSATWSLYIGKSFETVFTDLGQGSLRHLSMASNDSDLAPRIRKLIVEGKRGSCGESPFGGQVTPFGSGLLWPRDGPVAGSSSQNQWCDVLQRLPNCTQLAITAKSYYMYREAGRDAAVDGLGIEPTIELVLSLIASARMPLQHFNMWLCSRWQEADDSTDINWALIDTSVLQTTEFRNACARLKSFTFGRLMDERATRCVNIVIPLLKATTNLRYLTLYLDEGTHSLAFFDHLLSADFKCPLEEINIEAAALGSGESLRTFLAQHQRSLKQLRLRTILLDKGAWTQLLEEIRLNLKSLELIALDRCMQHTNEKYLHFDAITQRTRQVQGTWYHDRPVWRGARPSRISYEGQHMPKALKALIEEGRWEAGVGAGTPDVGRAPYGRAGDWGRSL